MNRTKYRRILEGVAVVAEVMAVSGAPGAAVAGEPRSAPPTAADFARLEREVADQRQMIIQMMTIEQERYNLLLKLLQSGSQAQPGAALPALPALPSGNGQPSNGQPSGAPEA